MKRSEGTPVSAPETELFQRLDLTSKAPYSIDEYVRRILWELTQATVFRWSPKRASRWRRALLRAFGGDIHATAIVRRTARVQHPWLLSMGAHSAIGEEAQVYNLGPICVGEHSVVSQRVHLCAGTHDYRRIDLPLVRSSITIGRGVWICADAFIGPGVSVGDNALVGAASVVVKDVPSGMIVAGNPARAIRPRPSPTSADRGESS